MIYQVSHINTENQQNCDDNRTAKETGGSSGTGVTFCLKNRLNFTVSAKCLYGRRFLVLLLPLFLGLKFEFQKLINVFLAVNILKRHSTETKYI